MPCSAVGRMASDVCGLAPAGAPPDLGTAGRFPRHRVTCPADSTILIQPRGDRLQELVPSGHQGAEAGEERLPWNLAWLQVPPLRPPLPGLTGLSLSRTQGSSRGQLPT